MFKISKSKNHWTIVIIFVMAVLLASCGGTTSDPGDIVMEYYTAIENGDADAAAAFFSEDAMVVTPSGNTLRSLAIKSEFIPYDLQNLDHVDFQTDFTESDGKITWTQAYHHVDGSIFTSDCEVTVEDGKIVEWVFN